MNPPASARARYLYFRRFTDPAEALELARGNRSSVHTLLAEHDVGLFVVDVLDEPATLRHT